MSPNENCPLDLHFGMVTPAIRNLMNEQQQSKWLDKAESLEIIGTYAQTEMGHGSGIC